MNSSASGGSGDGGSHDYLRENESETKRLIGSSVVLIALSTIFVALRLVSRKLSKAGFWVTYYAFPKKKFVLAKWIDADCDKNFYIVGD